VGLPRSGTHSLGYVFKEAYRADHEPSGWGYSTLYVLWRYEAGHIDEESLSRFLQFRDKRLALAFESSHFLHQVVHLLIDLFPRSKYIFTVREPLSWLESAINQSIKTQESSYWRASENRMYGKFDHEFRHSSLRRHAAYPVKSYLDYWNQHVERVMETVPPERLCVVKTREIDDSLDRIATFVGADPEKLDRTRSHSSVRSSPKVLVDRDLDGSWVRRAIGEMCLETVETYVPSLIDDMGYLH